MYQITFPTFRDPSKKIETDYGTSMIPEAYVIDRNGKIDRKMVGAQDWTSPDNDGLPGYGAEREVAPALEAVS